MEEKQVIKGKGIFTKSIPGASIAAEFQTTIEICEISNCQEQSADKRRFHIWYPTPDTPRLMLPFPGIYVIDV